VTTQMMRVELVQQAPQEPEPLEMHEMHPSLSPLSDGDVYLAENAEIVPQENRDPNNPASWGKIGRNESCPCGSGKKFKHCHGALV
jgi:preprotein translocase subunit SecA